jgi:hypothetical protein
MNIGIDYSIKSPAVTLIDSEDNYHFLCFPRTDVIKTLVAKYLRESGVSVTILDKEPGLDKKATLAERERSSLIDANKQILEIVSTIHNIHSEGIWNIKDWKGLTYTLGIEGFSFGSTGNRLAQISGYQWVLRYNLFLSGKLKPENLHVYAPMTVKATAGKGNFKKEQMIDAFLNSQDPKVQETTFWQAMTKTPEYFQNKKGAWEKPIDDLIDSFWVLQTLLKNTVELSKEECI